MSASSEGPVTLHASAIAFGTSGLLITGRSGAGKSSLAIELMGLGAGLVADDRVVLSPREGALMMSAPTPLKGLVEAHGLGILRVEPVTAWAQAVVDLDAVETERLPQARETVIAGVCLPLFHKVEVPAFPAMLRLVLTGGIGDGR